MTRYTVKDMAMLSGVSVRALHHYDEIGLLKPAHLGANGYRYYGREELLRLQQILFHRELGLPLERIKALLDDPGFDRVAALKAHRDKLSAERDRFAQLIATIDRTIAQLNGERTMTDNELYDGFSAQKQAQWEKEIEDRFGAHGRTKIAESKANFAKMPAEEMAAGKAEMEAIHAALAAAIDAGEAADGARVQALVARHFAWVCRAWKPNRTAYIGLGRMYTDSPDFRAVYETVKPGLTDFLAEAMRVYAETTLRD
ncbi:MAG: MerR family transcriptional regulator [Proteobacteria bacterium]|nr:MerR family transcriptional regulator [Pseudomonadota bacterium]